MSRRVLYVVTEDWYFDNHRSDHAKALIDDGFDVHVACRVSDRRERLEGLGVTVHDVDVGRGVGKSVAVERRALAQVVDGIKPAIVHAVALKPVVLSASILVPRRKVAGILAISGIGLASIEGGITFRGSVAFLQLVGRLRRCRFLFQNEADQLMIDRRRRSSTIIPGVGVDVDRFDFSPMGLTDGRPLRLLFLGRGVRSKGLMDLVEAVESFRGKVEVDAYVALDERSPGTISSSDIARMQRSPHVRLHPPTSNPELALQDCDVAVLPSRGGEGVSKFTLEAMSVGRPIIASNTPGNSDVVSDQTGFLFEPGSVPSLVDAISDCLAGRHSLPRMGEAAGRRARDQYGLDTILPSIVQLHRDSL